MVRLCSLFSCRIKFNHYFSAIICACLPTLRPLIKRARGFFGLPGWSSRGESNVEGGKSGNSGIGRKIPAPNENQSAEEILGDYRGNDTELTNYAGGYGDQFGKKTPSRNTQESV